MLGTSINISRVHFPVTTLGPGNRIGIWFQGCSIRCPGCISVDTWDSKNSGLIGFADLLSQINIWMKDADGVTISGGEPFDQPEGLLAILNGLVLEAHQDVLVYSGYPFEKINTTAASKCGRIDALISDPFDITKPQNLALRGSDNQRLHLLTELGRKKFISYDRLRKQSDLSLDVMFDTDGSVWLAGIPKRGDLQKLQELLRSQGHLIATSEDKRSL